MGYIKQLSENLIKKIAAGEVIERPASVVKELVENSIDASSTKIEIEITRATKYIKVSDNGMGIDPEDIELLFARHATSKIKSFDELWRITSLGFRGEALASISAVSKVTCRSKHINQEYGFEIKAISEKITKKSSAISIGTIFEIDDLFYNVPARQKFLKSEQAELGHIVDVVLSLALSHPNISFKLKNNENIILSSSGSADLKTTVIELLGNDLNNKLIPITAKNHFVEISGYVSSLEIYRSDRKSFFIFINNRPVKCQIISKAIQSSYEGLLPGSKFPIIILNLTFKPTFVDVNVHPAKKEVRYTHPNDVYNLVLHSIQEAIANHYKKEYKEKSVYALPEVMQSYSHAVVLPEQQDSITTRQHDSVTKYSEAALEFYKKTDDAFCHSEEQGDEESPSIMKSFVTTVPQDDTVCQLFSVNNLKCQIIYSDKPIVNMTKAGNKTIFEVGSIFNDNLQVVFSGEIFGEQDYQKEFFNKLSALAEDLYKNYLKKETIIQKKIINKELEEDEVKEKNRKKPQDKILYDVWERDHWTCVYCSKQLLDSKIVKEATPHAKDAFVSYFNKKGEKINNHILREHTASYDHYLPVSKLPQFNFEAENLYACCFECNRKKSDSMEIKTWEPKRQNSWTKPLEVAGICFITPKTFENKSIVLKA